MDVPIQKISAIHTYIDKALASSEINHPGHLIGGLLSEGLDRGPIRIFPGDNATERVRTLKQRRKVKRTPRMCQF